MNGAYYSPFLSPDYLKEGTERQQAAYQAILSSGVFTLLSDYSPTLAGTIPLDVDTETSDLDIICEVYDPVAFCSALVSDLSSYQGFTIVEKKIRDLPMTICRFNHMGFPFEIFGQPLAIARQNAYLHMLAEYQLLQAAGPAAKEAIRELKRQGLKTEPAFARYFQIPGDPYQVLLGLAIKI